MIKTSSKRRNKDQDDDVTEETASLSLTREEKIHKKETVFDVIGDVVHENKEVTKSSIMPVLIIFPHSEYNFSAYKATSQWNTGKYLETLNILSASRIGDIKHTQLASFAHYYAVRQSNLLSQDNLLQTFDTGFHYKEPFCGVSMFLNTDMSPQLRTPHEVVDSNMKHIVCIRKTGPTFYLLNEVSDELLAAFDNTKRRTGSSLERKLVNRRFTSLVEKNGREIKNVTTVVGVFDSFLFFQVVDKK